VEEAEAAVEPEEAAVVAVGKVAALGPTEETLQDMEVVAAAAVQVHRPSAVGAVVVQFGYN
jgi:hypothetical protein